jgi:hypothetical protein
VLINNIIIPIELVNIKNNLVNEPAVKIYNENHNSLTINDITNETNLISILEIQGIKFTTRNFQIEIELKQIMVLNNEPLFDNCLIKMDKPIKKQESFINPSFSEESNNETFKDVFDNDLSSKEEITEFKIDKLNDENNEQVELIIGLIC